MRPDIPLIDQLDYIATPLSQNCNGVSSPLPWTQAASAIREVDAEVAARVEKSRQQFARPKRTASEDAWATWHARPLESKAFSDIEPLTEKCFVSGPTPSGKSCLAWKKLHGHGVK
jgi:hypothetical protein